MKLYHGTIRENLESILNYGLRPYPIWDSGKVPVVCLTDSRELPRVSLCAQPVASRLSYAA